MFWYTLSTVSTLTAVWLTLRDICYVTTQYTVSSSPTRTRASMAVILGTLLAVLDLGLINISLPTLATELNVAGSVAVWISTGYQVICAATLLAFSGLSYILGKRKVYLAGLLLFALGALGSSFAPDFSVLMAFRIVQGTGAAALLALGPALLRDAYPAHQLGRAMALNALVVAGGLAAGPTLGGIVLYLADWRWIFALNLPLGLTAIWLTQTSEATETVQRGQKIDWQGSLFSIIAIAAFMLTMERVAHSSSTTEPIALALFALIFGGIFVRRQRRISQPLLPLRIFSQTRFSLSIITILLASTAQGLAFVALSFLYQSVFDFSPLKAAMFFSPWPISLIIAGPFAGRLSDRLNPAILSSAGLVGFVSGLVILILGSHNQSLPLLVLGSFWCGLGYGFFQPPNNHEIMANAPAVLSSTASGVLATARTLGQSLGSAMFALAWSFPGIRVDSTLWIAFTATVLALASSIARLSRVRGTHQSSEA